MQPLFLNDEEKSRSYCFEKERRLLLMAKNSRSSTASLEEKKQNKVKGWSLTQEW